MTNRRLPLRLCVPWTEIALVLSACAIGMAIVAGIAAVRSPLPAHGGLAPMDRLPKPASMIERMRPHSEQPD